MNDVSIWIAIAVPILSIAVSWGVQFATLSSLGRRFEDTQKRVEIIESKAVQGQSEFESLSRRHDDFVVDRRERAAAVDAKIEALERSGGEMRSDIRAITALLNRIEAKQDQEADELKEIRRDVTLLLGRNNS